MAAFDAGMQQDPTRMSNMENAITELTNEVQYLRTMQQQQLLSPPSPPPPPPPTLPVLHLNRPNLNLPTPPAFSGNPSELPTFKLKISQFLICNHNTYKFCFSTSLRRWPTLWFGLSMVSISDRSYYPSTSPPLHSGNLFSRDGRFLRGGHHSSDSRTRSGHPASDGHGVITCYCVSEHYLFFQPSMA